MYPWQSLLVCFLVIILHEYKSLMTHKLRSRWDCMMLQYTVIACLIQFALHLVQIPEFAIGKSSLYTITEPPPCFTVGVILGVAALLPTLHCFVQFFCALAHWSLLFCFFNCGFLTAILPYRPASQNLLFTVVVRFFFTTLVQLCCDFWSSQLSVMQAGDSEIFHHIGKTGSI